ncbi:MAG TPA: glutaredoxin family protein [Burkholderiales bacterium]|nr:glutaredoxin family protein [Burkholderiales bacterium]
MNRQWAVTLATALLLAPGAQAELYRWVDDQGRVHYSDSPPPPSARKIEKKRVPGKPATAGALPYELQQAVRNHPVTLFVSECGQACTQARQLLAKRGVPHTELDATDPATQEQLKQLTGGSVEVPVLRVGRQTLRGFEAGQWNSALDAAGYPKSALVKITPNKPQPPKPAAAAQPAAPAAPEAPGQATEDEEEG